MEVGLVDMNDKFNSEKEGNRVSYHEFEQLGFWESEWFFSLVNSPGIFLYNIADDRSSSFNDPEEESNDESDSFDQD